MSAKEIYSFGEKGEHDNKDQSHPGQYGEQEQGNYGQGSQKQEQYMQGPQREEQYVQGSHRQEQYRQGSRGYQGQGQQFDQEGEREYLGTEGGERSRLFGDRRSSRNRGPILTIVGVIVQVISAIKGDDKHRGHNSNNNNQNNYYSRDQGYERS